MVKRILAFALLAPSLALFDASGVGSTAKPIHFVAYLNAAQMARLHAVRGDTANESGRLTATLVGGTLTFTLRYAGLTSQVEHADVILLLPPNRSLGTAFPVCAGVSYCQSPTGGYFHWEPSILGAETQSLLRGRMFVTISTTRNPRGEIGGPIELAKPSAASTKESLTPSKLFTALAATPVPHAELPTGLTTPLITKTVATKTEPAPFHSLGEVTLNFNGTAYIFYSVFPTQRDANLLNQQSVRVLIGRLSDPVVHPPPSGFPSVSQMYLGWIKNYGFAAVTYVSGNVWVETFAVARGSQSAATKAALAVAHLSVRHLREVRHTPPP